MPFERVRAFVNQVVRGQFTAQTLLRYFQQSLETVPENQEAPGEWY